MTEIEKEIELVKELIAENQEQYNSSYNHTQRSKFYNRNILLQNLKKRLERNHLTYHQPSVFDD